MATPGKPNLKPLAEQVIVITGASSGIGRLFAVRAAEQGASVVLVARSTNAIETLAAELNQAGKGRALAVTCDVSIEQQVQEVASKTIAHFGRIDTWINNAAVGMWGRLEQSVTKDAVQLFATNFFGTVHGCQAALPLLRGNPHGGTLMNIGSEVSDDYVPLQSMYASSKHAMKGYTDGLRVEVQEIDKMPINIVLIQPQAVDTPFSQHARNYTPQEPALPHPLIDPQTVVDAMLKACTTSTRNQPVGGVSYFSATLAKVLPKVADKFVSGMIDKQHHDAPAQTPAGILYQSTEQMDKTTARTHPAPNAAVPDIKPKNIGHLEDPLPAGAAAAAADK